MSPRERRTFRLLSAIACAACVAFSACWAPLVPSGAALLAGYVALSALILFQTASWLGRWLLLSRMERPAPRPPDPDLRVAAVTTFVPDREPLAMLERTLAAMVAMDLPHDTWVLDEGDDPRVRALCARLGANHFSRCRAAELGQSSGRYALGTKHGNYNAWLASVGAGRYDVLAAFDPDHVPERGYLRKLLGHFADPKVAFVQSPQVYYNQAASPIARGAAEESYAYYSTHLVASFALGQAILIGSHNLQRISALEKVGGFASHDADDLLLSLRYQAEGLRGVYVPEVLALGLTPADWRGYLQQQLRWTQSVIDLKLRQLPRVQARLGAAERVLGLLRGAFYLRSLAIPVTFATLGGLLVAGGSPAYLAPGPLAAIAALAATLAWVDRFRLRFALDPETEGGVHWRAAFLQCAKWPIQALALVRALRGQTAPYAVTPKSATGGPPGILIWSHAAVALALAASVLVGAHRGASSTLQLLGLGAASLSVAIVASAFLPPRAAFVPALHAARRAALFGAPIPTQSRRVAPE